ncbi:MAG: hypothetical protein ACP5NE_03790 [Candidatus Micrarchaeia archaeon]
MPNKEKIMVWLDNDGVIKDDIEAAFARKGFGQMKSANSNAERFIYNAFKELMFVSLHLRMSSSANSLNWEKLPPREGIAEKAAGWIENGKRIGKEVGIGIITSNPSVDLQKLKAIFEEHGVEPEVVRVSGNLKKGSYLNSLQGKNVLVDDNYFSFLRLDTEKNKGVALSTDYTNLMRKYITKIKGIEDAGSLDEVDKKVLRLIEA